MSEEMSSLLNLEQQIMQVQEQINEKEKLKSSRNELEKSKYLVYQKLIEKIEKIARQNNFKVEYEGRLEGSQMAVRFFYTNKLRKIINPNDMNYLHSDLFLHGWSLRKNPVFYLQIDGHVPSFVRKIDLKDFGNSLSLALQSYVNDYIPAVKDSVEGLIQKLKSKGYELNSDFMKKL